MALKKYSASIVLISIILASGCAAHDPNQRTKAGAAVGAAAGAIIGHQIHGEKGRYVGAAAGAAAGAITGRQMDKQQQVYDQELANERQRFEMERQRIQNEANSPSTQY